MKPDGTGLRQITHLGAGDAFAPDWSPDGRWIAVEVDLPDSSKIALVRPDGSDFTYLPIRGDVVANPTFTADGRGIAFVRLDFVHNTVPLFIARLDGSHERQLTHPPAGHADDEPNLSPDGRTMSFVRQGPNETDSALFTLDLRSGRTKQLTPTSADVAIKTGWSPNGHRIVFSRDAYSAKPGVSGNVMTISRRGHHLRAVTHYEGGDVSAFAGSYSPDGRWIVYRQEKSNDFSLIKIHPDGSGATTIFHSTTMRPRYIDWGPSSC
jgi:Tol biopolymer transport system component